MKRFISVIAAFIIHVDASVSAVYIETVRDENHGRGYLVDPASNYMLVSKIKPCMYKYTPLYGETANGSLNQLLFLRSYTITWITVVILELIHVNVPQSSTVRGFIRTKPTGFGRFYGDSG